MVTTDEVISIPAPIDRPVGAIKRPYLMANETGISWTDSTYNVAVGCTKVSEACENCYMIRDMSRKPAWANVATVVTRTKTVFTAPLKWKDPRRIFTSSLTDLFHDQIDDYRWEVLDIMRRCPHHQFQVLTKRIERFMDCLILAIGHARREGNDELDKWLTDWAMGKPPANVWIGVSVGHPNEMHRLDELENVPATVRFVSFEPLLAPLPDAYRPYINWIIIGGESGPASGPWAARPCMQRWIEDLVDQYTEVEYPIAVFVKQMGSVLAKQMGLVHAKGEDPTEWPVALQRQEFPCKRFTVPGQQLDLIEKR